MAGLNNPLEYKDFWHQFNGQFENQDEQGFWDDQLSEWFGIYGIPMKYAAADIKIEDVDRVFGEITNTRFPSVVDLTGIIEGASIDENIMYNGFGQLNNVEFVMYVHQLTFLKHVGRKPYPKDQFQLKNDVSTQTFEVIHTDESTIGTEANFFGHRGTYVLSCREREVSQSTVGQGEDYGVTDQQGNLLPNAPPDALVGDGSGRVREKYNVSGVNNVDGSVRGDNEFINEVVTGKDKDGNDAMPDGKGIVYRQGTENPDWGDW